MNIIKYICYLLAIGIPMAGLMASWDLLGNKQKPNLKVKTSNKCISCGWQCSVDDPLSLNYFKFYWEPCPKCGSKLKKNYTKGK